MWLDVEFRVKFLDLDIIEYVEIRLVCKNDEETNHPRQQSATLQLPNWLL